MKSIDLFSGSLNKYLFLCIFLFTSFSCKDDPVKPPENVDFSISVEDVSCIEAWISLKDKLRAIFLFFSAIILSAIINQTFNHMKTFLYTGIIFLFFIFSSTPGCKNTPTDPPEPVPEKPKLNLVADDLSCTEAWVKLSVSDTVENKLIILTLDGLHLFSFPLSSTDTSIFIDSLEVNISYKLKGYLKIKNILADSTEIQYQTLNTTSHNFNWEIIKMGTSVHSVFYDVTIVDENDIWAAGDIRFIDSLGNESRPYGAAHWDGSKWELKEVLYRISIYTSLYQGALRSIINFGPQAVYATAGFNLVKWNGSKWEEIVVPQGPSDDIVINQLWGSDENNIYAAGDSGKVYKLNGNKWKELPTLTDLYFTDIYGTPDGQKVWVCGYHYSMTRSILLEYEENSGRILWERIGTPPYNSPSYVSTVWAQKNRMYFGGGRSVYSKSLISDSFTIFGQTNYFPESLRGSGYNNIFVTGDRAEIWHFDGLVWRLVNQPAFGSTLLSIAAKGNIVVAVGSIQEIFPYTNGLIYISKH